MLAGKRIGFALTGSFCTLAAVMPQIEKLVQAGAEVFPIISSAVAETDTRFGKARDWLEKLRKITGRVPWNSIVEVEPIGPKGLLDLLIVAPCTGNTMAKLALGITDSPVLMASKAQLRNERPVLLGISTNDALGANASQLGKLLNKSNLYFVPFAQDDPLKKPSSLVAKMDLLMESADLALRGQQLQPVLR
jgi:dipicolinate synthase subunit B